MMKIQREEHGKKGAFFIEENGEWIAEMTYFKSGPGQITIDHTEVDPNFAVNTSARTWSSKPRNMPKRTASR